MGQYFKAVILNKNKKTIIKWIFSHDFGSGLKLMEHSWIENPFVKTFERLIHNNPKHVVWAGDYANKCKGLKTNVYSRCSDKNKVSKDDDNVYELSILDSLYIINHTKKEYVNKVNIPNNDGWRIHPLPLLTCEGNGLGGGDYYSENGSDFIGTWARDLISVSSECPDGYKEIRPNFLE